MLSFEWDDEKERKNVRKHRLNFQQAAEVFSDVFRIEFVDKTTDFGELRFNTIGLSGGRLMFVTFTDRSDKIRIISARRADGNHQKTYARNRGSE